MPKLMNSPMQTLTSGTGNFRFSAVRPEQLGATEYTLVTIVVDITSSVYGFKDELLAAVKAAVKSCANSARADNLLIRLLTFNTKCKEIHGFKPFSEIDPDAYKAFRPSGMTALYDACYDAITATNRYAQMLVDQDFEVNAAVYVITDGCDNHSQVGPRHIAEELRDSRQAEILDSLITVLIGVNTGDGTVKKMLVDFKDEAELSQYINAGDATPANLSKLAAFVSRSISLQSQTLGSGSASQSLTF